MKRLFPLLSKFISVAFFIFVIVAHVAGIHESLQTENTLGLIGFIGSLGWFIVAMMEGATNGSSMRAFEHSMKMDMELIDAMSKTIFLLQKELSEKTGESKTKVEGEGMKVEVEITPKEEGEKEAKPRGAGRPRKAEKKASKSE